MDRLWGQESTNHHHHRMEIHCPWFWDSGFSVTKMMEWRLHMKLRKQPHATLRDPLRTMTRDVEPIETGLPIIERD